MKLWNPQFLGTVTRHLEATGSVRDVDLKMIQKDGGVIDCAVSAEKVEIDGKAYILLAWVDITYRRRSELELADAIETVMSDSSWFSKSLVQKLANVRRDDDSLPRASILDLTRRERQVLDHLGKGLSDKEIAKALD